MSPTLCSAREVDAADLESFLRRSFPPAKAELLIRHGDWRHRGGDNQLVLVGGGQILGYCGLIPVDCRVDGTVYPAAWWIDLVIEPRHRGQGLQRAFDDAVRRRTELLLGFPNAPAAAIHRRHGWGVREDLESLLLPLRPTRVNPVLRARGGRRLALEVGARLTMPAAAALRRRLATHRSARSRRIEPDASRLASLFADRHPDRIATVVRDPAYLDWRYLACPWADEHRFYAAGDGLAAVARSVRHGDRRLVRVLDLVGEIEDEELMSDLLRTVGRDAVEEGAVQITLFSSLPPISNAARRAGFRLPARGRFCWYSSDSALIEAVDASPQHWVLGDSDHDEPVDHSPPHRNRRRG